jgi:hypothetical protein
MPHAGLTPARRREHVRKARPKLILPLGAKIPRVDITALKDLQFRRVVQDSMQERALRATRRMEKERLENHLASLSPGLREAAEERIKTLISRGA